MSLKFLCAGHMYCLLTLYSLWSAVSDLNEILLFLKILKINNQINSNQVLVLP